MTWDDATEIGLRLPGVTVSTSYGTPALKLRGKLLTRLRPEDDSLVLGASLDEKDFLIESRPDVFHTTPHYDGYGAVLARLATLDAETLERFLRRAWSANAGKRLAAAHPEV